MISSGASLNYSTAGSLSARRGVLGGPSQAPLLLNNLVPRSEKGTPKAEKLKNPVVAA